MTEVLKWAGIVGAIWLTVSILVAVGWAAGGRRIFRKPPAPPRLIHSDGSDTAFGSELRHRVGDR